MTCYPEERAKYHVFDFVYRILVLLQACRSRADVTQLAVSRAKLFMFT